MSLMERINHRKNEHHVDCGGHGHNHDHHEHAHDEYEHHNHTHHDHDHGHCHDEHCACDHDHEHHHGHGCSCCEEGVEIEKRKTIAGVAVFLIAFVVFHIPGLFQSFDEQTMDSIELVVFLLIYLVTAREIVVNAIKNLFKGKALDEQFLMSVASLGAFFVGEYPEACAVMLFYMVGELFQDYAVDRSRDSITELMDIRPDYANLLKNDGTIEKVDPNKVKVGNIIVVKPGEKVPLDGTIIEGQGSLDTSSLTGESLPREVLPAEQVISGSISVSGALTIKVTKAFGESTVSKILELVENASSKKAKTEKFITRFAKVYTPIVVGLAIALAIVPPLVNVIMGADITDFYGVWNDWIYRALTFLVISCPCALVISTPLSFFAGIGAASTQGVLVKGSNYLELIAHCDTVVFDKTGTLTEGVFKVSEINAKTSEQIFLQMATIAEMHSNHPIAKSIKDEMKVRDAKVYYEIESRQRDIKVEEIPGKGTKAVLDDSTILAGNEKLMESFEIVCEQVEAVGTVVYVAVDNQYIGYVVIEDCVKQSSKEAMSQLKEMGVENLVMLTGDRKKIADKISKDLQLDKVYSELLPADKVEHVEELLDTSRGLAFVGDGVNDAPVLARADIGIAMGAMGSDAAIEAADIVLMDDNPMSIVKAMKIARKTIAIAKENIVFALGVKVIVLALAALGIASMWAAVFADVGVCVLAIINAMRAAR